MSTLRTETIQALEQLHERTSKMLALGVELNQQIFTRKLPVPPLDLEPIHKIQRAAESALYAIELKATMDRAARRLPSHVGAG